MPAEIHEPSGNGPLVVTLTGRLGRDDYDRFVPRLEQQMKPGKPTRLLVELHDFHGWDVGGLWEDLKFDARHFNDLDRVAIVGDRTWQKLMTGFCRPFTSARVQYFEHSQIAEARAWVNGESG